MIRHRTHYRACFLAFIWLAALQSGCAAGSAATRPDHIGQAAPAQCNRIAGEPWNSLLSRGRELTSEEERNIRAEQRTRPEDPVLHARVLLSYSSGDSRRVPETSWKAALDDMQWLVKHCPRAPLLGEPTVAWTIQIYLHEETETRIAPLWQEQAMKYPNDPQVLSNAALFLGMSPETSGSAKRLLERLTSLEPREERHRLLLAKLAARSTRALEATPQERDNSAKLARKQYMAALALHGSESTVGSWLLAGAGQAAIGARASDAEVRAVLTHYGHVLEGLAALKASDVKRASDELEASLSNLGPSPPRDFVPSVVLANQLLRAGQRDAVLAYLRRCQSNTNDARFAEWIDAIENGQTPVMSDEENLRQQVREECDGPMNDRRSR